MFLGLATYETLDERGELKSYIMSPAREGEILVADDLKDVDRSISAAVDVGPLRVYADRNGIRFRFVASHMGGEAFRKQGDRLTAIIRHTEVPLPPNHAGYYGLLLPRGYTGDVALSIRVDRDEQAEHARRIFLTDTSQIFASSDFYVYADQRARPSIRVTASLVRGAHALTGMLESTFSATFGGYIDGLHDTSIAGLIREVNRNLSTKAPQVFVCHCSEDKPYARRIAHALSGRGFRVWIDEAEIHVGDSLIEKIESGILKSHNLIVIMTPRSVSSRWCREELRMALAMQIGGERTKVLPALFEDCKIPGFLMEKVYADFRDEKDFSQRVGELAAAVG
jgi:TIR domain